MLTGKSRSSPYYYESKHNEGWDDEKRSSDERVIADDYLRLTDTCPIAEPILRNRGFVDVRGGLRLGNVAYLTSAATCGWEFFWYSHNHFDGERVHSISPQPRNGGELEQIIRRVNGDAS